MIIDENHSAWRAMCQWLNERDAREPRPDPNGWEEPYDDDPPDDGANQPEGDSRDDRTRARTRVAPPSPARGGDGNAGRSLRGEFPIHGG